ncbi:isochorismatase family protein [Rhodoferax sp. OV413]|uniref:isochorismatase family protein n=1 Tax=Rhodoferax sp. OV413 TaxID=1855285 RepID=UPI0025DB98C8|nr:isochorismatase family protein [Rhodoferax sp. OV413]
MSSVSSLKTALLVIDVQESFLHTPYWQYGNPAPFQAALLRLQAGCRAAGVPVVHIFHVDDDLPFRESSGLVRPMSWLPAQADASFCKHTHNAFTDTGLDLWLRRQGVGRIIVSGIRTEQCCETTTRVGADIGYAVDFVSEATLTFPMTHQASGRTFSAEDITLRTELVLQGRFARIVDVDTCLAELPSTA